MGFQQTIPPTPTQIDGRDVNIGVGSLGPTRTLQKGDPLSLVALEKKAGWVPDLILQKTCCIRL